MGQSWMKEGRGVLTIDLEIDIGMIRKIVFYQVVRRRGS